MSGAGGDDVECVLEMAIVSVCGVSVVLADGSDGMARTQHHGHESYAKPYLCFPPYPFSLPPYLSFSRHIFASRRNIFKAVSSCFPPNSYLFSMYISPANSLFPPSPLQAALATTTTCVDVHVSPQRNQ